MAAKPNKSEIIERVLVGIEQGEMLVALCEREGIARSTFYNWLDSDPELGVRFARARDLGFDVLAENTVEIADKPSASKLEATDKRIQIDTRLKLLEKWDRKRYGNHTTFASDPDAPLIPDNLSNVPSAIASILAAAEARKAGDGSDLA